MLFATHQQNGPGSAFKKSGGVRWCMSRQILVILTFDYHNYFRSFWKHVPQYSLLPNIRSVQVCKHDLSTVSVHYSLFHALMILLDLDIVMSWLRLTSDVIILSKSYCHNYWTIKHSNSLIIKECVFCTHSLMVPVCGPIQTIG